MNDESVKPGSIPSWQGLRDRLNDHIFEQPEALESVVKAHQKIESGLSRKEGPLASMLFLGPTGSGKTELAKIWADYMKLPFFRYDCSAFSESHTVSSFIGAPPGYMGSNQPSQLASDLGGLSNFVILLDELEKAHTDVVKLFLSVLDSGLIKDRSGEMIDFRGAIIIMTTNAGINIPRSIGLGSGMGFKSPSNDSESDNESQEASDRESDENDGYRRFMAREQERSTEKQALIKHLQNWFPAEFLGRLSAIQRFNTLSETGMERVLTKKLNELQDLPGLKKRDILIQLSSKAMNSIVTGATAEGLGARPILHVLDRHIIPVIAERLTPGGDMFEAKSLDVTFSVAADGSGFVISDAVVNKDRLAAHVPPPPKSKNEPVEKSAAEKEAAAKEAEEKTKSPEELEEEALCLEMFEEFRDLVKTNINESVFDASTHYLERLFANMGRQGRRGFRYLPEGDPYLRVVSEIVAGGRGVVHREGNSILFSFVTSKYLLTVKESVMAPEILHGDGQKTAPEQRIAISLVQLKKRQQDPNLLFNPDGTLSNSPLRTAVQRQIVERPVDQRPTGTEGPLTPIQRELVTLARRLCHELDTIAIEKQIRRR